MEVQYKIKVSHQLHIRPTVSQLTGYSIQHYVFVYKQTFQNTAMTRSTQNHNSNGQHTRSGTQCDNKLTINCQNVLDCHTSHQSHIVVSNMSIAIDLKVEQTTKSLPIAKRYSSTVIKMADNTIVSGTKRQHVTEQLSLIPIKNRGELRTQVIQINKLVHQYVFLKVQPPPYSVCPHNRDYASILSSVGMTNGTSHIHKSDWSNKH